MPDGTAVALQDEYGRTLVALADAGAVAGRAGAYDLTIRIAAPGFARDNRTTGGGTPTRSFCDSRTSTSTDRDRANDAQTRQ